MSWRNHNSGVGINTPALPQSNHILVNRSRACRCRCIRRPGYVIPNVSSLVNVADFDQK